MGNVEVLGEVSSRQRADGRDERDSAGPERTGTVVSCTGSPIRCVRLLPLVMTGREPPTRPDPCTADTPRSAPLRVLRGNALAAWNALPPIGRIGPAPYPLAIFPCHVRAAARGYRPVKVPSRYPTI